MVQTSVRLKNQRGSLYSMTAEPRGSPGWWAAQRPARKGLPRRHHMVQLAGAGSAQRALAVLRARVFCPLRRAGSAPPAALGFWCFLSHAPWSIKPSVELLNSGAPLQRCRRNRLANAPFPLPILSRGRRAAGPGLCGGLLQRCRTWARLVPEGFAGRDAEPGRLPLGPHRVGHLRAGSTACAAAAGRRGRGLLPSLRLRGGHGVGLRLRQKATEQRHLPPHPRRGAGL